MRPGFVHYLVQGDMDPKRWRLGEVVAHSQPYACQLFHRNTSLGRARAGLIDRYHVFLYSARQRPGRKGILFLLHLTQEKHLEEHSHRPALAEAAYTNHRRESTAQSSRISALIARLMLINISMYKIRMCAK